MARKRNRPGKNERKQLREKKRKEKLFVAPDQSAQPDPPRQAAHDGEQDENTRIAEDVKERKLLVRQKPKRNINRTHAEEIVRRLKRQNDTIKYINDGQWKTDARLDWMGDRVDDLRRTLTDLNNRCNRAFVIGRTTDDKAEKALSEVAELVSRVETLEGTTNDKAEKALAEVAELARRVATLEGRIAILKGRIATLEGRDATEIAQHMEEMGSGNEQLTLEMIMTKGELRELRDLGQPEVIEAKKDADIKQSRQARNAGGKVGTEGAWNGRLRGRKV
ncbi:hypothetical protein C8035_v004546 [Colletotrichum spinosum]|uniref:Uncharacterized protein n=1 Tax=Colletotrichum spinosum TaxID=1347390 RepID=A0A4R8PXU7_9PEZI|nr:hypothetical protein C8035_v004546 [Colletotrichum spinosum]